MNAPVAQRSRDARLQYARVLVELGELDDAEIEIADALDETPDDLDLLNLLSKVKHMKGELSQAIACWAQLHARSPHNELTLMRLGALMQMAKDPARAAGEYVALQPELVRRPAAHVEIEAAFALLLQRRVEDAKARCDRVAAKNHGRDREAYKLAIMAKAWIAELTGDFETACRVLEQLGTERGFETDTDCVLSLARLYERIGTQERLEKAVHVFRFLDRSFEKMSAQSRLASLHRKLGEELLAREYEQRFTESFMRRMHRVSRRGVAEVAATRFLPIEKLRAVHTVTYSDEPEPGPRAAAIERAMAGDVVVARASFEKLGTLLDRKYVANLAALAGDAPEAARLYASALVEDGPDLRVLEWLLGPGLDAHPTVRAWLASGAQRDVREAVEAALRAHPQRASLWREVAALERIVGNGAQAARCLERAAALEDAARRDANAIGRVLAAAVYRFVGKGKGIIHRSGSSPAGRAGSRRVAARRRHPRQRHDRHASGVAQRLLRRPRVRALALPASHGGRARLRLLVQGHEGGRAVGRPIGGAAERARVPLGLLAAPCAAGHGVQRCRHRRRARRARGAPRRRDRVQGEGRLQPEPAHDCPAARQPRRRREQPAGAAGRVERARSLCREPQ